jgi:uncharacterized protein (DUF58 family)
MKTQANLVPKTIFARGKTARRFSFAFGRMFFILLLVGMVWMGPGWADHRFFYAMLAWDVLVLAIWAWDLTKRVPRPEQVTIARAWSTPPQLALRSTVRLELSNAGATQVAAWLIDDAPRELRSELPEITVDLPANGNGSGEYEISPAERGDAKFGTVFVRCQSSWRIAERRFEAPLQQTVRIYPNLEESKRDTLFLIRSRQTALEKRHKRQRGQGREFESLREYREGDEWRDISWSATARRGKLISTVHQVERSQTVWLVLDSGRLLRARTRGLTKLDYAVGAALSMAQVALYSGDQVAMMAYGRKVKHRLAPGRGSGQVRALLESLAEVRTEEAEADHIRAAEMLLNIQKRRSLVIWLTDLSETAALPDVIESAMRLATRHMVLFTVIGQPELRELLQTEPQHAKEMYRFAAAQEIVHRRDFLLRTLRQRGALTLEVEPARLATAVVNQYLMTKERGLI